MTELYFTKTVRFEAAHQLLNSTLSEQENQDLFGKCVSIHGHNFICKVTLKGVPDPKTGMIMNASDIKAILYEKVVDEFDHQLLNEAIPEFNTLLPTTENMCIVIWNRIKPAFGELLYEVRISETETIEAYYRGH